MGSTDFNESSLIGENLFKQQGKIKIKHGLITHGYVHQPRLKWQSVKVSRLVNFSYPQFLIGMN